MMGRAWLVVLGVVVALGGARRGARAGGAGQGRGAPAEEEREVLQEALKVPLLPLRRRHRRVLCSHVDNKIHAEQIFSNVTKMCETP